MIHVARMVTIINTRASFTIFYIKKKEKKNPMQIQILRKSYSFYFLVTKIGKII